MNGRASAVMKAAKETGAARRRAHPMHARRARARPAATQPSVRPRHRALTVRIPVTDTRSNAHDASSRRSPRFAPRGKGLRTPGRTRYKGATTPNRKACARAPAAPHAEPAWGSSACAAKAAAGWASRFGLPGQAPGLRGVDGERLSGATQRGEDVVCVRVPVAGRQQRVDVAAADRPVDRPYDDPLMFLGEQARNPADTEAASDHAARSHRLLREGDDVRLEARLATSISEEPLGRGNDPVVAGEIGEGDRTRRLGEPVVGWQADEERLLDEVDALDVLDLTAGQRGVLVAQRDVELAAEQARFERAGRHLVEEDADVAVVGSESYDRRRDQPGHRGGEAADADVLAALAGQRGDLVIGVLDQDLAGGPETQSTPAALEEPDAELGLEQRDLAGHGGLRPRKTFGRTRERALVRDDAEGQEPTRVHSFFQC